MVDFTNVILQTERLHIRAATMEDVPFFEDLYNDPIIAQRMMMKHPIEPGAYAPSMERGLANARKGLSVRFILTDKRNGTKMGHLFYNKDAPKCPLYPQEIGYSLAVKFHGNGFAHEAVTAFLKWHFEGQNQPMLLAGAATDNVSSLKLIRKLGFQETRPEPFHSLFHGYDVLHTMFILTKSTYQQY